MPKTNTLIKICGLTSKEQALQVAKLGAHAIGIISVEQSPRYISAEIKKNIFTTLERLYPKIERVSVVQNCPIDLIIKNFLGNPSETIIQLHGDEDIDYCKKIREKIPNIGIWKAFRIKTEKDIDKIKPFEDIVDAILLDSWNKETYGGSGKKIKSAYLKNLQFSKPWWLAGGISIEWINEILADIKPDGIDISSSIEISPGLKDIKKTEALKILIKEINFKNNIHVINDRIENLAHQSSMRNSFNIATTRAVSNPSTVSEYILPMLKKEGLGILYCGKWTDKEGKNLDKTLEILEGKVKEKKKILLPRSKGTRNIILIQPKDICPKIYPRKVGKPEKNPL